MCSIDTPLHHLNHFAILPSDHPFHLQNIRTKHHPIHPIILEKTRHRRRHKQTPPHSQINSSSLLHTLSKQLFYSFASLPSFARSLTFTLTGHFFSTTHSLCDNTHCLISTLFYTHFISFTHVFVFQHTNVLLYSIHFFRFRNHLRPPFWTAALPL